VRLAPGSRVLIVGGGPAGSFTALHLLHYARQAGLDLEVILLEPRDFGQPGPGGCNKCAGILSSTLIRDLEGLGLQLPQELVQSELEAYILHLGGVQLTLKRPDPSRRIVSIYRGSGPRAGAPPYPRSFDAWLLDEAQAAGAVVRRERARAIQRGERPTVLTARDALQADLVVLATGVNSRAPLEPRWGYRPPRREVMAQDEVLLPAGLLDRQVRVFFDLPPGLVFGGLIPKGPYANISLLGRGLPPGAVAEFLEVHGLQRLLPEQAFSLCGCTPHVAVSSAVGYYGERMVVVGDAAVTRLYKDGIGAAFTTARAAARTAVEVGVSRRDFAEGYRPVCRRIAQDNLYGRLLFRLWTLTRRSPFLLDSWRRAITNEASLPAASRVHTRTLWGMFTGDDTYRQMFRLSLTRRALRGLLWGAIQAWRAR